MSAEIETDYLIVGGGLTGCVIASRLAEYLPQSKITLVEAGTNEHLNPAVLSPAKAHALRESDHVWKDSSIEQRHLNHRRIPAVTGKMLSGSSAMNAGCWTRCSSTDYDQWALLVGEGGERWNYENQLPYFKKSETWFDQSGSQAEHGFDGPVKVHSVFSNRKYPLREQVKSAILSSGLGIVMNEDGQAGNPIGLSAWTENWYKGQRQPSGLVYSLEHIQVLTGHQATRILLQNSTATDTSEKIFTRGVLLDNGESILAKKEVIVCCGAFRTPQLLMVSGIGPGKILEDIGIDVMLRNDNVGQNLHDQTSLSLFYRLKHGTEKGLAMGSPNFNKLEYGFGSPVDWLTISSVDPAVIKEGLLEDGVNELEGHPLLVPGRPHTEMVIVYGPAGLGLPGLKPPLDGSIITAAVLNLLPTSRGSITLTSSSVKVPPEIDPNYYATATDRNVLRAGVRNILKILNSFESGILDGEMVVDPFNPLSPSSTDQEIDERVKAASSTWYHFGGTAAMGKVVDSELRVIGVQGLRVVDASVLPCPLGGHYQAAMFALGEQAAEIIANL